MAIKDKLYICDLDGTLLDNNARLSDFAFENLTKLIEQGVSFTIATARSIISVREILRDLPIKLPIIEVNGSLITDYQTGYRHTVNSIPQKTIKKLYHQITSHGCEPFISSYDGRRDNLYYSKVANDGMVQFLGDDTEDHATRIRYIGNIEDAFTEQVVCVTVIDKEHIMCRLHEKINSKFPDHFQSHFFQNPYFIDWHWLTIHDRRSCKARAVKQLASQLDISLENVVVFGDGLND